MTPARRNAIVISLFIAGVGTFMTTAYVLYRPVEYNNMAVSAIQAHDFDQAIALLREATKQRPGNPVFERNLVSAFNSKAISLDGQGRGDEAREMYQEALKLAPRDETVLRNFASSLNNAGVDRSRLKDFTASQSYFERASALVESLSDPTVKAEIRNNYSSLMTVWGAELLRQNRLDDARNTFNQARQLSTSNSVAAVYLGDIAYESNAFREALECYQDALERGSDTVDYLQARMTMLRDELALNVDFRTAVASDRFLIQVPADTSESHVKLVSALLEESAAGFISKWGMKPPRAVNVRLYHDRDFYKVSKLPEWAVGSFDGKLRIKTLDVAGPVQSLRDIIAHEYTHAVLSMNVRVRVPAWFHEGFAQYTEPGNRVQPNDRADREKLLVLLQGAHPDLGELTEPFKDLESRQAAEGAYLLSRYFVEWLARTQGDGAFSKLLKLLAEDVQFEDAFSKAFGGSSKSMQQRWMRDTLPPKNKAPRPVIRTSP